MKGGFDSEILQHPKDEVMRADNNIPLTKFNVPGINWRSYKKNFGMPERYLRTCTLKEGTITTMVIYQTMCAFIITVLTVLLVFLRDETSAWWYEKFRNDLDYYYQYENQELIKQLHDLWEPFTLGILGAHVAFFMSGWCTVYALFKKTVHPCWYLPWIIVSCLLTTVHWIMFFVIIGCVVVLGFYRDITVTWDIVPLLCIFCYGLWWTYSCIIVIAHYRRRCIVRYWINKRDLLGTDNYPPEIKNYLYEFAKSN